MCTWVVYLIRAGSIIGVLQNLPALEQAPGVEVLAVHDGPVVRGEVRGTLREVEGTT